jgi:predicted 2-oxoglutarate/Fe(II)-dependent dioxygenase YbiX
VIETITRSAIVAGGVLRQSRNTVDMRLRRCSEHVLAGQQNTGVVVAMESVAAEATEGKPRRHTALDGPKFCSYSANGFFRVHRDRSEDPLDPAVVRNRRLSIVCLLNDASPEDGLPVFDGGALVVHVSRPDGIVIPENIQLSAGSVVVFPSDLLHEVRPVRSGVRFSAISWLYDTDDIKEG